MAMRPSGHVPRLRGGRLTPMSEINVDLPETKSQTLPGQDEPVEVTVNAEGKIFIQETEVELQDIVPRLVAITENKRDTRLFVRGDRTINYGRVMQVMGAIDAAGFRKVALVTKLPQGEQ
jgi:biopolymer transport protein TolR